MLFWLSCHTYASPVCYLSTLFFITGFETVGYEGKSKNQTVLLTLQTARYFSHHKGLCQYWHGRWLHNLVLVISIWLTVFCFSRNERNQSIISIYRSYILFHLLNFFHEKNVTWGMGRKRENMKTRKGEWNDEKESYLQYPLCCPLHQVTEKHTCFWSALLRFLRHVVDISCKV